MLGLNQTMSAIITKLRVEEIVKSLKMRKLFVAVLAFGNMSDIFAPGAAFAIYVIVASGMCTSRTRVTICSWLQRPWFLSRRRWWSCASTDWCHTNIILVNGQSLDVTSAFTALSLIALLVAPVRALVFTTPTLLAALGCFSRIEDFLSLPVKKDHRMQLSQSPIPRGTTVRNNATSSDSIDAARNEQDVFRSPTTTSLAAIHVENLTLSWTVEDKPVINDVSLEFQSEKLTMIVGPVGSGKSSLLKGILGEVSSSKGKVYTSHIHVAFVDQTPWIQNTTVRKNITGVLDFELEWYEKVVYACTLDTDIETLSEGDATLVGSGGAALSGGQKLRIVSTTHALFPFTAGALLTSDRDLHELYTQGTGS